jgi:tetratricopeptide (TPR) repeat protein
MKTLILLSIILVIVLKAHSQVTGIASYDNAYKYYNTGDFQKAISYYTEYIASYPGDSKAYNERGLCYENLGQFDIAEENYSNAISISQNNWEYYNNRGYALLKMGNTERALSDFSRSILLSSLKSNGYAGRMETYIALGNYDLALKDVNSAMNSDINNPFYLINRAIIYLYLEDTIRLFQSIDTILTINPYNFFSKIKPEYKLFSIRKFFDMIEKLSGLLTENPESAVLYFRRGFNFYMIQKFEPAKNDFETCLKLLPESENTLINFAKRFIENCSKY